MIKLIGLTGIIIGLAVACMEYRIIGLALITSGALLTWKSERTMRP